MRALALAALLAVVGCRDDAPAKPKQVALAPAAKLELIEPPAGDVVTAVAAEVARAAADHAPLVVYVGATWCEPCVDFHKAAAAGRLDRMFPGLRVVAFDADRDEDALADAGYTSEYIPLFVIPEADGKAGPRRFEGGFQGDGAVDSLALRLHDLIDAK